MGQISLSIPQSGQPNSTEDPKVASDLTTIQTVINGNLDVTNISAALAQSGSVNQAGQTAKGATNISTSQSTGSITFTTLGTADQVTGIVLPTNGIIRVWFLAQWQESTQGAAQAAIFVGSNQLQVADAEIGAMATQFAMIGSPTPAASNATLVSCPFGLVTGAKNAAFSGGFVTTGQAVGVIGASGPNTGVLNFGTSGSNYSVSNIPGLCSSCDIFAAAGTYTVSVQFKASSGTVTVANRRLWVQAVSFA